MSQVKLLKAGRGWRHDVREMAAQSAFDHPHARVDGASRRTRLLISLIAYIVQKGGTGESLHGHFVGAVATGPPAHEVRQAEGIPRRSVPGQAAAEPRAPKRIVPTP